MAKIEIPATYVDWFKLAAVHVAGEDIQRVQDGARSVVEAELRQGKNVEIRRQDLTNAERGAAIGSRIAADTLHAALENPDGKITVEGPPSELSWVLHEVVEEVILPALKGLANGDPLPVEDMRPHLVGLDWAMGSWQRLYAEAVAENGGHHFGEDVA